ncbi:MAG: hypothetical protein U1D00_21505 [Mycobacterium sp.]|nr:hypothetical protein [Mycobacterium sp.]
MLSDLRRVLDYEMTVAEWIGAALLAGVPYLAVGVVWSLTHTADLAGLGAPEKAAAFLWAVVAWPVLLVADVCMP